MEQFLNTLDLQSVLIGLLAGVALAIIAAWISWRRGAGAEKQRLEPEVELLQGQLGEKDAALASADKELAVTLSRLDDQKTYFANEKAALADSEKRLTESFERLAGKVFDDRSRQFTDLSEKQLEGLLKPLSKDLETFRAHADAAHREELKQNAALRERLLHLEGLNKTLNEEARNLTRALTADVKTQGSWGEQQLERLLELGGLKKGENYLTQHSVSLKSGQRLQPDLVLLLPENRTIVMDSKVSLTAWTRLQATDDEQEQQQHLSDHVRSIRSHIDGLAAKNYSSIEELNALDFVLMFVPIEAALIAALREDPSLPEYALKKRIALLSPANFLATVRTVASVWMVHKQNTNARDIASRAGLLYDKFVGFTENLKQVGARLDQAQNAYESAMGQLSTGRGNLVKQAEDLRILGAKHNKQLQEELKEKAELPGDEPSLKLVKPEDE